MVLGRLTLEFPLPLLPANPVNTPVVHDLICPLRERRRVIEPLKAFDYCQPCLLEGIPRGIIIAGEDASVPPKPLLPPLYQFLECLPITILASQHQQLVNYPFTALHRAFTYRSYKNAFRFTCFFGLDKHEDIVYIAFELQISRR